MIKKRLKKLPSDLFPEIEFDNKLRPKRAVQEAEYIEKQREYWREEFRKNNKPIPAWLQKPLEKTK